MINYTYAFLLVSTSDRLPVQLFPCSPEDNAFKVFELHFMAYKMIRPNIITCTKNQRTVILWMLYLYFCLKGIMILTSEDIMRN